MPRSRNLVAAKAKKKENSKTGQRLFWSKKKCMDCS